MKRYRQLGVALVLIAVSVSVTSCEKENQQKTVTDNRAIDEAAIRETDAQWLKAAQAKNADGWVSYYAENAIFMFHDSPAAAGKEAIKKVVTNVLANPGFALTFGPTKIEVSKSGDLAYDLGTYSLTMNDAKGKPQTTNAMYLVIWAKQADGSWKAIIDSPTSTMQ